MNPKTESSQLRRGKAFHKKESPSSGAMKVLQKEKPAAECKSVNPPKSTGFARFSASPAFSVAEKY